MSVEIKELVIRAVVSDAKPSQSENTKSGFTNSDPAEIVADCVERVMELLKQASER